jgi:hypothetical protein
MNKHIELEIGGLYRLLKGGSYAKVSCINDYEYVDMVYVEEGNKLLCVNNNQIDGADGGIFITTDGVYVDLSSDSIDEGGLIDLIERIE